jgi:hypothetical protein
MTTLSNVLKMRTLSLAEALAKSDGHDGGWSHPAGKTSPASPLARRSSRWLGRLRRLNLFSPLDQIRRGVNMRSMLDRETSEHLNERFSAQEKRINKISSIIGVGVALFFCFAIEQLFKRYGYETIGDIVAGLSFIIIAALTWSHLS